jgi:uncharacterized damage-inducible protein DinB
MAASASVVRELLLYMLWADREVLAAVREVSAEDLTRDAGISFGSLLGTMAHMLGSQRMWLSRFYGRPLDHQPGVADFPDLLSWIYGWEETAAEIGAFVAALTEEQLAAPLTWTNSRGETRTLPLWQPALHLVTHTAYHRGQVVSLLRQMGYQPPATDLVKYFTERATATPSP